MSPRLDIPLALAIWVLGFAWVARGGSWVPLAVAAIAAAVRLLAGDSGTRRLLAPRRAPLVLGGAGAAAMVAVTYLSSAPLAHASEGFVLETRRLYSVLNDGVAHRTALVALVLLVATCEEIVWRGRALEGCEPGAPRAVAVAVASAAVYAAAHAASGSALLVLVAFACGVAWALLRLVGRSLWPAVIAHTAWDLAVLFVWPLG